MYKGQYLKEIKRPWKISTSIYSLAKAFENDGAGAGQKDTQSAFTCSKLTIETIKQGVKYVQS